MKYYLITNQLISRQRTKEFHNKKPHYIVRKFESIEDFNAMVDFVQVRDEEKCESKKTPVTCE